jgi:trimeric autotransporter adhesin
MNINVRTSLSGRLCFVTALAALLVGPLAAQAQTINTATGFDALFSNTAGSYNSAAGVYSLYSNTSGNYNTANGYTALYANTTGNDDTAMGLGALFSNTTGSYNTATGLYSLYSNTTGSYNSAAGVYSLFSNITGNYNTANGYAALYSVITGGGNTATGYSALTANIEGTYNTATGFEALYSNTTGHSNTATGRYALAANISGPYNVADGGWTLFLNTTGTGNTATGVNALYSNTTGTYNAALGYNAGYNITTGSYNIDIGSPATATDSGIIRIGTPGTQQATYIAGINGVTASGGVAVYINANGQLGTLTSSQHFKHDIKDLGDVSDKLMDLRPVMFRYNDAAEKGPHALQYGLIAEEVAKIYPNLVQYDKAGKPFTVYYHLLTPMLLNELQKEHHRYEAQRIEMAALKTELVSLRQAQQQQMKVLAKLTAYVETAQVKAPLQTVALVRH